MNFDKDIMINDEDLINLTKNSYMSKESFIKLLEEINFSEVKDVSITCITGYKIKTNDHNKKYVDSLGFDITIN